MQSQRGKKHFAMALCSHLEQRARLNSFGSHSRNTSSRGPGQPAWEASSQEGMGNLLAPVNDTMQMTYFEQLDKFHPMHLRRLEVAGEESNLSCGTSSSRPGSPLDSSLCGLEKNYGLLPHLTKSRKLLFLFRYQEHAHFSYQHVSLLWFYALL